MSKLLLFVIRMPKSKNQKDHDAFKRLFWSQSGFNCKIQYLFWFKVITYLKLPHKSLHYITKYQAKWYVTKKNAISTLFDKNISQKKMFASDKVFRSKVMCQFLVVKNEVDLMFSLKWWTKPVITLRGHRSELVEKIYHTSNKNHQLNLVFWV